MFAGGAVQFGAPLRVGDTVRREMRVVGVTEKAGRQGDFVVVVVETRLLRPDGAVALVETQDLVYRDAPDRAGMPSVALPDPQPPEPELLSREGEGRWRFRTDPTKLMRFSSASGNGHRIHYDWPYATGVEGYPALVVHGPLMTLALAEVVRLEAGAPVRSVTHRNRRPLFCGRPAAIRALPGSGRSHELVLAGDDAPDLPNTTLSVQFADE
jgi:3-methylfumaryl-CoA hydratase